MSTIKDKYDVVIIGAGISGLCAAVSLAKLHLKVLVVEKNNQPGGLSSSFMLGEFEVEPTLHHMIGIGTKEEPGFIRQFFDKNNIHISWIPTPSPMRLEIPNDSIYLTFPTGYENVANAINEIEPGSYEKVMEFFNLCEKVFVSQTQINNYKISYLDTLGKHNEYANTLNQSLEEVLNTYDFSKRVKDILTAFFFYYATPCDKFPFTTYACFLANFIRGTYVCDGFANHIVLALAEKAETLGVDFLYGHEVKNIFVKGNKVRGVRLDSSTYITTTYLISGAQINNVYSRMISNRKLNKNTIRRLNARTPGYSSFDVFLILDKNPAELGIFDYSVFNGDTLDSKTITNNSLTKEFTKYYNSICMNYTNPNAIKNGKTMLSLSSLVHPDVFSKMDYMYYTNFKNQKARDLIEKESDRIGCNLFDHIIEIEVFSPVDYTSRNGSYRGNVFGFMQTLDDHEFARGAIKEKGKIKNLYFANSCGLYGGGIHNGINTVNHITAQIKEDLEDRKHENKRHLNLQERH